MKTLPIPNLWTSSHGFLHRDRLRREASEQARSHALPISPSEFSERLIGLKARLMEKLKIETNDHPLDFQIHGEIARPGYTIQRVSFASAPGIRVTGSLYIPGGEGPFPAVLSMHGHRNQGKLATAVQARGHLLALSGIVTLTVDAAGSGERCEVEREWSYHGSMKAAELFLAGDSLMGVQIRDNRKALDVLQSLPFVNGERLGATGPSGGGNQTMWLSALDERVKVAVPVVSIGSFEVYVTECNCMCETLPGGLKIAEEWELLGLMAPRPLLIMNALHDREAFGYQAMSVTCQQVQEVYALNDARDRFDFRLIDMTHGYHAAPLQAMLGWMRHWLLDAPSSTPVVLPDWTPVVEEELLCYSIGERPEAVGYKSVRETIRLSQPFDKNLELAELVGWNAPAEVRDFVVKKQLPDGTQVGAIQSSRDLPLPVVLSGEWDSAGEEIRLILSPSGKKSDFVTAEWQAAATAGIFAMTADFPGVGELAWETDEVAGARLHDTARACLWLGYSLVGEWAEAIASICLTIRARAPHARIHVLAEQETIFAALLGRALHPEVDFKLTEAKGSATLTDLQNASLAWCVPNFLQWGDLDTLRSSKANPR